MKNTDAHKDNLRAYSQLLNQPRLGDGQSPQDIIERIQQKTKPFAMYLNVPQLDYPTAKEIFRFTAESICKRHLKRFVIDEENRAVLQNLVAYFMQDQTNTTLSIQKGIYLYGPLGVGKTFIFQAFQLFCQAIPLPSFSIVPTQNIVHEIEKNKSFAILEKHKGGIVCFDDLGQEPKAVKIYHREESVMATVLSQRYETYISQGQLTHITSNLLPSELESCYGSRIADRCRQLFNFVPLGNDKSKSRRG